jgi:hypothetical protein
MGKIREELIKTTDKQLILHSDFSGGRINVFQKAEKSKIIFDQAEQSINNTRLTVDEIKKICLSPKVKTHHISCTGNKYTRNSPKLLAHAIYEAQTKKLE